MKLFVKYKNGSVEIVNVSELSYHTKNPCLNCRKGGGCYDHGCFMPEDWGDFLLLNLAVYLFDFKIFKKFK